MMFLSAGLAFAANSPADIQIHFVPQAEFKTYVPACVAGNIGFFAVHWNGVGEIVRGTILIANDVTTQGERMHTFREELTQALGLMKDSYKYPESIFYQGWSLVGRYAEIDRAVIRMLYDPKIRPDMDADQARKALEGKYTPEQIDYFIEIAFGAEYAESDELIHKWTRSPTIHVSGELTDADVRTVYQCVNELNNLTGKIQVKIAGWSIQARKEGETPDRSKSAIADSGKSKDNQGKGSQDRNRPPNSKSTRSKKPS